MTTEPTVPRCSLAWPRAGACTAPAKFRCPEHGPICSGHTYFSERADGTGRTRRTCRECMSVAPVIAEPAL